MKRPGAAVAALALAVAAAGCAGGDTDADTAGGTGGGTGGDAAADRPRLAVTGAYVPEPPLADMAAGYFTIANTGRADDTLTAVTSDIAARVTLHSTKDGAMSEVGALTVPARGRLVLRTGGHHLMQMGLERKPKAGDTVTFVLRFAVSSPITVRAPVRPATYRPEQ